MQILQCGCEMWHLLFGEIRLLLRQVPAVPGHKFGPEANSSPRKAVLVWSQAAWKAYCYRRCKLRHTFGSKRQGCTKWNQFPLDNATSLVAYQRSLSRLKIFRGNKKNFFMQISNTTCGVRLERLQSPLLDGFVRGHVRARNTAKYSRLPIDTIPACGKHTVPIPWFAHLLP